MKVFNQHGFHAAGMDLLVKETGISKTAMYNHFRTKDDLVLAVLRYRDEQFRNWFVRRVEQLAKDSAGQLLASFDALREWFGDPGFRSCLFIKASSEFMDPDNPVFSMCAEHKRLLLKWLEGKAEALGVADPKTLATQIFLLQEGAIVAAHLSAMDGPGEAAKQAASALIRQAQQPAI